MDIGNIRSLVRGAINTVNPDVVVQLKSSTGWTKNPDGTRTPSYAATRRIIAQIQALDGGDIQHADSLNIQGQRRVMYVDGQVNGLVRVDMKGGDLVITPDSRTWLVADVPEYWAPWTKCILTLQNGA